MHQTIQIPHFGNPVIQRLPDAICGETEVSLLRLDQLHPEVSGNKWYKLKYNLEAAREAGKDTILTFGGPWSNHIAATAAACGLSGFNSVGIIRGSKPPKESHTLARAREHGMELHFVSRAGYASCREGILTGSLGARYGEAYVIPEGGYNPAGIRGCAGILADRDTSVFTHICCAVGTGATVRGIAGTAAPNQRVLGFSALRGDAGPDEKRPFTSITGYHFGGFARKTPELLAFMREFLDHYGVLLDFVYTAKMMYGIQDLAHKGYFPPGSRILAIHSGGLQGNRSLDKEFWPDQDPKRGKRATQNMGV